VDYPDAAFLEGVPFVLCGMSATNITGIITKVSLNPFFKYHGTADSATALTTTFPAGTNPDVGDIIVATADTGIKQQVLVTSVAGQVATHGAWPRLNISASTTSLLLVGGDDVTARGGINVDVVVSSRSVVTQGQVNLECDIAVSDYFDPKITAAGDLKSDVLRVSGTALKVGAAGTVADPFGPA